MEGMGGCKLVLSQSRSQRFNNRLFLSSHAKLRRSDPALA